MLHSPHPNTWFLAWPCVHAGARRAAVCPPLAPPARRTTTTPTSHPRSADFVAFPLHVSFAPSPLGAAPRLQPLYAHPGPSFAPPAAPFWRTRRPLPPPLSHARARPRFLNDYRTRLEHRTAWPSASKQSKPSSTSPNLFSRHPAVPSAPNSFVVLVLIWRPPAPYTTSAVLFCCPARRTSRPPLRRPNVCNCHARRSVV